MKILITGASGFIGKSVFQLFLNSGFDVVTLGRGKSVGECPHHKVDLLNRDDVRAVLFHEKPTHLIHLAWYTEHGKFWDSTFNYSWVLATNFLFKEFVAAGGEHIVASGSCAEYAPSSDDYITEDHPIDPSTTYGICKNLAHMLALQQLEKYETKLSWLRIFFPYGAGDESSRLVPTLHRIQAGLSSPITVDKGSIRDFIHVNDIAKAFKLLISGNIEGTYNLCSGKAVSIGDLVDAVAACYSKPVNILSSEKLQKVSRIVGETKKLRQAGWSPSYDILKSQQELMLR